MIPTSYIVIIQHLTGTWTPWGNTELVDTHFHFHIWEETPRLDFLLKLWQVVHLLLTVICGLQNRQKLVNVKR